MNRRRFLHSSLRSVLAAGAFTNTLFQLRGIGSALAAAPTAPADYKGLVCLFLKGGNDSLNNIVPVSGPSRSIYATARGVLAVDAASALPITPARYSDGNAYGFHPRLPKLRSLFASGRCGVVANVGTLVEPVTKANWPSRATPPQLFSHSDQQVQWQSGIPDQPFETGWGGRIADLLHAWNDAAGSRISLSMTLSGNSSYLVGSSTGPYAVTTSGSVSLAGYGTAYASAFRAGTPFSSKLAPAAADYSASAEGRRLRAFHAITGLGRSNLLEQAVAETQRRAYEKDLLLADALGAITLKTQFPQTSLGQQLAMIARLVAARDTLAHRRQIFYAEINGFDTHDSQTTGHDPLLTEVDDAVAAFHEALVELGVSDKVTLFSASDFGRTLTPNKGDASAGSDHAWGGHAFVVGGAVQGGDIHGRMPDLTPGGPDDVDEGNPRGRYIPTLAVDQYAATLARWFGVSEEGLDTVFPNLRRFSTRDAGFMKPA